MRATESSGTIAVPDTERLARLAAGSDELSFRVLGAMSRAAWAIAAGDAESLVELFADALAAGLPARRYLTSVRLPNGARITVQRVAGEAEMGPLRGGLSAPGAPEPWLRVPIGSAAHDYGELVAVRGFHGSFNRAERRRLQEVADLVAGALDAAVAVDEQRRAGQRAVALLELSQLLADAGPSDEVALRLLDAVRLVVDCDRVSVLLWDPAGETFTQRACGGRECATGDDAGTALTAALAADGRLESFIGGAEDVMLVGPEGPAPALSRLLAPSATQAAAVLPLVSNEGVFGVLVLALIERPERFEPSVDLLERLRGVAAQAAVAMTNGRLVDLIAQHALHDSLTGLANRLQFHDMLRASVDLAAVKEASVALMYIDLDGFKPINDQYGHDVGDELLVAVGERLREVARASDSVGRLGGDEFAILLTSAAGVGPLAGRLAEAFEHPFEVAGRRLSVGASIGWAAYPEDADSAEGLIQAADAAMYVVKQSHKRSRAA